MYSRTGRPRNASATSNRYPMALIQRSCRRGSSVSTSAASLTKDEIVATPSQGLLEGRPAPVAA